MSACGWLGRAVGALLAVGALGCGEATDTLGSVMLAISTDMYVDKDVSRVDIVVQPARGPLQSTQINLFPELEGQFLPGTFSIIEGSEPGELVRVRVIARQDNRVRVVREAALKVPRQRTALLSMPIQWLCDGQVRQEGQLHRSDCDDGFTCISGTCQPEEIDETTLPDYEIQDVFGGGDATGGGSCFDTLECFQSSTEPVLDLDTCRFSVPDEDQLNVAVVLPPGGDGHCTGSECWIPLDRSELTGWFVDDASGQVQLPIAICERARTSGVRVLTSRDCASKAPATPTCGPWTLVGTEPGADIDTPNPNDVSLVAELAQTSQRLAGEVAGACASVTGASPPAEPSAADVTALCAAAQQSLSGLGPLTWHASPTRCSPDHAGQLECESDCDASCDPGTLEQRCVTGGLAGVCGGSCESRVCLADAGVPIACAGACAGSCAGACEGNCLGACDGVCSNPTPDGYCDGTCAGTCAGLCQGRCQGTCEGRCNGDPGAPAAPCAAGSLCVGGCAGGFEGAPTCDGPIGSGPCGLEPGCQGNCQVMATFKIQCERPSAWVLPKPGLDPALQRTLGEALPALVNVRDAKTLAVLDEATRLQQRMRANSATPEAQLTQVDALTSLLGALTSSTTNLLLAAGQERSALGPPVGMPPNTCEPVSATGNPPLIDDFEDGDALLSRNDGRDGAWHVAHDGTGTINLTEPPMPELGGANGSGRAMHLSGSGFTVWGAGLTVDLREGARPYDASLHQGISFWAKGYNRVRLALIQANLSPAQTCGGGCTLAAECGLFYTTEVAITDVWTQVFVPWSQLTRDFQGGVVVGPEQLLSIRFEGPAGELVDLWLDDVAFY